MKIESREWTTDITKPIATVKLCGDGQELWEDLTYVQLKQHIDACLKIERDYREQFWHQLPNYGKLKPHISTNC